MYKTFDTVNVQISPAVEALVHVSELGGSEEDASDPEQVFKLHETKNFKILSIDTEARKISLSFKD